MTKAHPGASVFEDLGFSSERAENLRVRSELALLIRREMTARNLNQTEAGELFGVSQPRMSDLLRGKIHQFSIDALVAMLAHAGESIDVSVSRRGGSPAMGGTIGDSTAASSAVVNTFAGAAAAYATHTTRAVTRQTTDVVSPMFRPLASTSSAMLGAAIEISPQIQTGRFGLGELQQQTAA